MANNEKDEQVSPEFLRKLEALKKKENGTTTGNLRRQTGEEEQPPAELLRKLDALKKGAGPNVTGSLTPTPAPPAPPPAAPTSTSDDVSPEFLRKLDALKKGGQPAAPAKAASTDPEVSPELLRKINAKLSQQGAGGANAAPPAASAPASQSTFAGEGAIEKAIELMRQLPINDQNVELMMQVVKSTLESFNINIDSIIADAAKKRRDLEQKIQGLQQEVASFEDEIRKRTTIIHGLRRQYEEITLVGDRLLIGQKKARPAASGEIGAHLTDSELWGADDEETSAAIDALMPAQRRE